jgi:diaminopimelate epimerase
LLGEEVEVDVRGGRLIVSWAGDDQHIWLTGPTEMAYEGRVEV